MSFQIPATTTPAPAPATGFSFGLTSTPAAGTGGTFGSTGGGDAGTIKPNIGGFFAQPATLPTFGAGAAQGMPIPAATTTAAPSILSFGTPAPVATVAATTTAPATLSLPKTTTGPNSLVPATSAPLPLSTTTAAPAVTTTGGYASLSTVTKTTDSGVVTTAAQVSYNQLEEHINKWTLELEEQEKVFTDQATQINAWDKILISNNQKILELNDAVQKVKSDQQTLEQELEFIATQHKELEESIAPLQKEFMKIPQVDMERSQTYLMVENLDTQLKQMSEDLKEIIDNLNEANKGQDSTDPIIQIGKILNAHMSSLQWIESSSNNIGNKLDEITKMHESFKRDSERSFRSAYYN